MPTLWGANVDVNESMTFFLVFFQFLDIFIKTSYIIHIKDRIY